MPPQADQAVSEVGASRESSVGLGCCWCCSFLPEYWPAQCVFLPTTCIHGGPAVLPKQHALHIHSPMHASCLHRRARAATVQGLVEVPRQNESALLQAVAHTVSLRVAAYSSTFAGGTLLQHYRVASLVVVHRLAVLLQAGAHTLLSECSSPVQHSGWP